MSALVKIIRPGLDVDVIKVLNAGGTSAVPTVLPWVAHTSRLVQELKLYDIWNNLTTLGLFGCPNVNLALLDWKTPGGVYLRVNSMAFVAMRGFQGDGASSYLNTQVNQNAMGSQSSEHLAAYQRAATNSSSGVALCGGGITTSLSQILSNGAGKDLLTRANQATSDTDTAGLAADKLYVMRSRTGATTSGVFRNGVKLSSPATASAVAGAQPIYVGARNNNGTADSFSNAIISLFHGGSGLADGQAQLANQAVQRWITNVNIV